MIQPLQPTAGHRRKQMRRACRSACLPVFFLCAGLYCTAQNQTTPEGLKTGPWTEEYDICGGICKIDLNDLETGKHQLRIVSCHTGGDIQLTITE